MNQISFKGLGRTRLCADRQKGPTCWLEALENVIQLCAGDVLGAGNNISSIIRNAMIRDSYPLYIASSDNVTDPYTAYVDVLKVFGIKSRWFNASKEGRHTAFDSFSFNHSVLTRALDQNRVILAVVDVSYLPQYRGEHGYHALVITDYLKDAEGKLFYKGLDSNYRHSECMWPKDAMAEALNHSFGWLDGLPYQFLITDAPARWPFH